MLPAPNLQALQPVELYLTPRPCALRSLALQVLEGCPWLVPKPLFLLAAPQPAAAAASRGGEPAPGLTYSLRTRVAQADAEDELSRVLGRRAADGSPLIRCSQMRDGVVAFEDEADAERYGQMLEADGAAEVSG
jgi:hypothetical protein